MDLKRFKKYIIYFGIAYIRMICIYKHQSFVSASHVFHMLRKKTCFHSHVGPKKSSKSTIFCSSTLAGDDFFSAPVSFVEKSIHQIHQIREVGEKNSGHDDSFLAVAFTFGGGCGFHDLGRES